MPDTFSQDQRSAIMRLVKSKDTSIEVKVRATLWRLGLRFRKHLRSLPGNPDIVFTKKRTVIFIDSCFWHGCPLHLRKPKSNTAYWDDKIARNVARDRQVDEQYKALGWQLIRIWEHELKTDFSASIERIVRSVVTVPDPSALTSLRSVDMKGRSI
jgi:DNA mismatch endonuclease, patch repair protein